MKKVILTVISAIILSACASSGEGFNTSNIHSVRGKKSSRMTDAELKQYNKQRENELVETATQAEKRRLQTQGMHDAIGVAKDGIEALQQLRWLIGK